MDRITEKRNGKYGVKTSDGWKNIYDISDKKTDPWIAEEIQHVIDRLAAYEEIGLSPKQLLQVDAEYERLARSYAKAKSRLKTYQDAYSGVCRMMEHAIQILYEMIQILKSFFDAK